MSAELLPCPFCQSPEVSVHLPTCTKTTPYDAAHRAFPKARCRSCGASKDGKDWDQTGKSAIEAWNTRAAPPPLSPPDTGNVGAIPEPSDDEVDLLLAEIDQIARNYDHHDYGLPTHDDDSVASMRAQVQWFFESWTRVPQFPPGRGMVPMTGILKRYEEARQYCLTWANLHPDSKEFCHQSLKRAKVSGMEIYLAGLLDDMALALKAAGGIKEGS